MNVKYIAAGERVRRELILLFCFLLSLPASSMAQSFPRESAFTAPFIDALAAATSAGQAIHENPFARGSEADWTPAQSPPMIPPIGSCRWPVSSLRLSFTSPVVPHPWTSLGSAILVLDHWIPSATEQHWELVPASTGLSYAEQSSIPYERASHTLCQLPLCESPGFRLPRAQSGASSDDAGKPLTSPKMFAGDVLHDEARIWKFPWEVAHGHHWKPALAFTLATAGLIELDPHDAPYFRRTSTFSGFNATFGSLNTGLSEGFFPVGFFLAGHLRKDAYMERTALLAGEALADAEIVSEVMKNVDRRLRPR